MHGIFLCHQKPFNTLARQSTQLINYSCFFLLLILLTTENNRTVDKEQWDRELSVSALKLEN